MTNVDVQDVDASLLAEPSIWVRFGTMDQLAVQQARQVLQRAASRTGANLMIDLTSLDREHELPLFVLLLDAAQAVAGHGGSVTALNPTEGLPTLLVDAGVQVTWLGPPRSPDTLTIDIGVALPALGVGQVARRVPRGVPRGR